MKKEIVLLILIIMLNTVLVAQGFNVKASGTQTFNFEDKNGRNQVTFFSSTPLEDITGTANGIYGKVTFDVANFAKTLRGELFVKVASMNTGIDLRNQHLKGANWLYSEKYPEIIFLIKEVVNTKQVDNNKIEFKIKGDFTLHGVTKVVIVDGEAIYLDENEQTKSRAPGDLLGVKAKFLVKLSEYGISNQIIGSKVAENIEVSVNIVGSNKI